MMMGTLNRISATALSLMLLCSPALAENEQKSTTSTPPATYGPGMMQGMTPEQRQQHWDQMREQGYSPGMGRHMTPDQRQQHWEQMRQQGYGPGVGPGAQ